MIINHEAENHVEESQDANWKGVPTRWSLWRRLDLVLASTMRTLYLSAELGKSTTS